ncbi:spermine oxidase [Drosophila virilis]|uniref:Amine oxidase domain-containing protein n=1 Tax=Drosophila virilis TaxID=7244 RepID=B4MFJ3_DROVI|nr:spermine oxidase [Drosophila virilis]XP_032291662.1 spermine oxidase-like [Drosophila virilis]EDW57164.1 uncharacterized protein Dvir_GJ15062 [Drosophila virilis]
MGSCCAKKTNQGLHNRYHASKRKSPKKLSLPLHQDPKILILGAGVSGLACAVELKRHGFENVRIVEMSNRIGGRIRTMKFADNYIDLGAQWVYGQQENVVYQMVKEMNMLEPAGDMFRHMDWIRSSGQRMSRSLARKLVNVLSSIYRYKRSELFEREGTFGEYLVEKFAEELSKPGLKNLNRELAAEFLRTFKKMEGSAVDTDMSASGYETYRTCHGENHNFRERGFKQFLRVLLGGDEMNEQGLLKDCIDLNTRVMQIDWDRADGTVLLSCEDDKKYIADHVVVTVSLGVLKRNTTFFHPYLPQAKRKAINFMGFGSVCKIFAEFEEQFWQDNWRGFNAMWRTEDMNQPQLEWVSDIYAFHVYACQPRVLLGWAAGPSTEVIETIDGKLLAHGVVYMLKRFLPQLKIPHPKRVVSSKWSIDPAHLGAYSYRSLLTNSYKTGPDQLAQPVNMLAYEPCGSRMSWDHIIPMSVRPILLFAGEATSSTHYSTVHGAVETGMREAQRLTGYYQKDL